MTDEPNLPAPAEPPRQPWSRQPGETARSYRYFVEYRDDPTISLAQAARNLGRSTATLQELSVRWNWVERRELYYDWWERQVREQRETDIMRATRREGQAFRFGISQVMARLYGRRAGVADDGTLIEAVEALDPSELDFVSAASVLERFVRGRRLADGQPTDFLVGRFTITAQDLREFGEGFFEISLRYIDEDRQPRFAQDVERFITTGRVE